MNPLLQKYASIRKEIPTSGAQAITTLLHPHAEVVLHELKTGKIAAIYNNLSKRNVGDESLIEELPDYTLLLMFFRFTQKLIVMEKS